MSPNTEIISIILPTYNEKGNIISLINEIHNVLQKYKHEIIVVDDNSPDNTYGIVKDCDYQYVHPIMRTSDYGFAKSIRCGIENAIGEIIIIMDSDFNHQPSYLPFMINSMEFYDCVSGSRFLYGGGMGDGLKNEFHNLLSWVFNIFVRIITNTMITDSLYGYICIKKNILKKINYDDIFFGYGDYCIRLMYYIQKRKIRVLQFPAINGERKSGTGNSNFIRVFLKYFYAVIALVYKKRIMKR